ncbi:hypothetical protein Taro_016330 [Colocasia esculenta]|uniref:Uncharacterized protein n=1 Tax=Colocasia esculenta TaxID=4460 RepID=A0A843UK15_COLES|nr:hypothetical protein [Colocasia esculenta]
MVELTEAYLQLRWRQRQEGGGRPHWRCRLVVGTCERWRRRGESRRRYCRGGWRTTGVERGVRMEATLLRRENTGVKVELRRGSPCKGSRMGEEVRNGCRRRPNGFWPF